MRRLLAPWCTALQLEAEVAQLLRVHVLGGSSNATFTCSNPSAPSSAFSMRSVFF